MPSVRAERFPIAGALLVFAIFGATSGCTLWGRQGQWPDLSGWRILMVLEIGNSPFEAVVADWDKDGRPDLAVSLAGDGGVLPVRNLGSRKFNPGQLVRTGDYPRGLGVGDLNGDGLPDLTVAHAVGQEVGVLLGDGRGSFMPAARPVRCGVSPFYATPADMDEDGQLDLVVVNESNVEAIQRGIVGIHWGQPGGVYQSSIGLEAGKYPAQAAIGDLDGDGLEDIVVTNWGSGDLSVFLNEGARSFRKVGEVSYPGGRGYGVGMADFNSDGRIDVAVTSMAGARVIVFPGDGHGGFLAPSVYPAGLGARGLAVADLNGDGFPELITANTADNSVSILVGSGQGDFRVAGSLSVGEGPRSVSVSDLDADGKPDLAITNQSGNSLTLVFQ